MTKMKILPVAIIGIIMIVAGVSLIIYSATTTYGVMMSLQDKNGDGVVDWHDADISGIVAGVPDGKIDQHDFGYLANHYGETPDSVTWDVKCDLNNDNVINMVDNDILNTWYNTYVSTLGILEMFNINLLLGQISIIGLILIILGIVLSLVGFGVIKTKHK